MSAAEPHVRKNVICVIALGTCLNRAQTLLAAYSAETYCTSWTPKSVNCSKPHKRPRQLSYFPHLKREREMCKVKESGNLIYAEDAKKGSGGKQGFLSYPAYDFTAQ